MSLKYTDFERREQQISTLSAARQMAAEVLERQYTTGALAGC